MDIDHSHGEIGRTTVDHTDNAGEEQIADQHVALTDLVHGRDIQSASHYQRDKPQNQHTAMMAQHRHGQDQYKSQNLLADAQPAQFIRRPGTTHQPVAGQSRQNRLAPMAGLQ